MSMEYARTVETTHDGNLFSVEVIRFTDAEGRAHAREVVRHPGAVTIVAVIEASHGPEVVLIRNDRIAVDQVLWELPAGKLEPGEAPADAAARELQEETGYRAGSIEALGRFYTSPGFADELMHVFVATGLAAGGQRLQDDECIEAVQPIAIDALLAMIRTGEIIDGKSIAALLMWLAGKDARSSLPPVQDRPT